jgi:putative radical SAM enzyme (TIGR03279 family)
MQMINIDQIMPDSPADLAGIEAGDQLLAVDSRTVGDIVDYYLALEGQSSVRFLLQRNGDLPFEVHLELEEEEDPGLVPEHPTPACCGNACIFCFVHQLPKGLRRSLYVKDEDYRFSWLYGSYVTLTNILEADLQRIISAQLSPLYISVHATDDVVRSRLLGKQVPPILPQLQRLTSAGIELHTQIVLCPEFNDADILRQTVTDLATFWPQIRSLAVVPVGLTRHREHLPPLAAVSADLARDTLALIGAVQEQQLLKTGSRFVFAADEFYLRAGQEFPSLETYEELWQLENGVGMVPLFRREAEEVLLEALPLEIGKVSLVTGTSFASELANFSARLSTRVGVELQVVAVENRFFGSQVSVAGLLTGADILAALEQVDPGVAILLPDVLFNDADNLLLDDLQLEDLQRHFKIPILRTSSDPWGILAGLERLDSNEIEILQG